jgi:hypothetical protein
MRYRELIFVLTFRYLAEVPQTERELHSATTAFNRDLLLTKAPSEPYTSAIRPQKKEKKKRGMPHLEEESPRTRAAAIAIGREKSPQ